MLNRTDIKAVVLVPIVTGVAVIKFQNRRRFSAIVPMAHRIQTNAPAMALKIKEVETCLML